MRNDTIASIDQHLHDAHVAIVKAQAELATLAPPDPPTPPDAIPIGPGTGLQGAIDAAPAGATLVLDDGTYDGAIVINKSVTLLAANLPAGGRKRIPTKSAARVTLTCHAAETVHVTSPALVTLRGLGITNRNPNGQAVTHWGDHLLVDRCAVFGDPLTGLHRGLEANGADATIVGCLFDDIFGFSQDTQSICGWNGTNGLRVDTCTLRGGTEVIMFGGADAESAARVPTNIAITNCTLTQNPAWYGAGAQIKTPFELKAARHVHVDRCLLEYAGIAGGQAAYLFVLTVRNQSGSAPWSVVEHVVVENCVAQIGGGAINFLGTDYTHPSETMSDVTFRNVHFKTLSRSGPYGAWVGSGHALMYGGHPAGVTIDGCTFEGDADMLSLGYFPQPPNQPVGLTLRNINYRIGTWQYGWKIDAGGFDVLPASDQIAALMPDLTYDVTDADAGASV